MSRQWTAAQRAAIDERSRTLLVSAAAGSGKTAVLTERIIASLTDPENPIDISRILVVTFTRAAAGELRKRISSALSSALAVDPGNRHLTRQLMLLGGARISTIDSFYLDLVRANFEKVGFSPTFRLADDTELYATRREIMNRVIDRMYAEEAGFSAVADLFSTVRDEASLTEALLEIVKKTDTLVEGPDILLRSARMATDTEQPFSTPHGKVIKDMLWDLAENGICLIEEAIRQIDAEAPAAALQRKFASVYTELLTRCRALLAALEGEDADAVCAALSDPLSASIGRQKMPEISFSTLEAIRLCDLFREKWKKTAPVFGVFDRKEIREGGEEAALLLRLLHKTLTLYLEEYAAAKRNKEIAEFSDISRAAYQLLVERDGSPTAIARALSCSFDAIYIDEYQDVNAMQDATFRAISTEKNRFMVGDIKQSIYRFRGAAPAVFASYKRQFPLLENAGDNDPAASVLMSSCFRCDENVIRFSNTVSSYLFKNAAKSIGYTDADDLVFSKQKPSPDAPSALCHLLICEAEKKERSSGDRVGADAEARAVVAEIKRLLGGEKKADGTPIRYGDIAILSRSTTHFSRIAEMLEAEGIPTNNTARQSFFENPEVLCMYSLLASIDNPMRDIYFAATLRSPFFGFTLEELISVRAALPDAFSLFEAMKAAPEKLTNRTLADKCARALARLDRYREKARILPVDKLLRYLYRDTAVLSFAGVERDPADGGKARRANLLRLFEYARSFEAGGFKGLYSFVRYVDEIMSNDTEMPTPEGPENAVSLITIHHSKGLEFPVCFIFGTGSRFNLSDTQPPLLCDERLGCGIRLPNAGAFSRANTFYRAAISTELLRLDKEEEMRVLYVAMTRAKERLYISGRTPNKDLLFERASLYGSALSRAFATDGSCYLEWILSALLRAPYEEFCRIHVIRESELDIFERDPASILEPTPTAPLEDTERAEALLRERFAFTYPFAHLRVCPQSSRSPASRPRSSTYLTQSLPLPRASC